MKTLRERFEEKFTPEPNTGCWLWTAFCDPNGYGRFAVQRDGQTIPLKAPRVAYELYIGPIPATDEHHSTMVVRHTCDTPRCVNPAHLVLGTQRENINDMLARGRSSAGKSFAGRRGERHGRSKLTQAQVDEMRSLWALGGITTPQLGERFGITRQMARKIVAGKSWTHVPEPA